MLSTATEIKPVEEKSREELIRYAKGLEAVLSTNFLIASTIDLNSILGIIIKQAMDYIQAEIGGIFLLNDDKTLLHLEYSTDVQTREKNINIPIGVGIAGHVAKTGKAVSVSQAYRDEHFFNGVDSVTGIHTDSYLCVPLAVQDEIVGTAQLINKKSQNFFTREEALLFEAFARQAAIAVKNHRLLEKELSRQRFERDINICARIQQRILPDELPGLPGYGVSGSTKPCQEVGGDWFDFIKRKDGTVDFLIADVSGKGISAGLIVAKAHAALQVLAREDLTVGEILEKLNLIVYNFVESGQFITLFYVRLQPETGELTYVNAGHNAPHLYDEKGMIHHLRGNGRILGLYPDTKYDMQKTVMKKNSLLVMFTDGFTEAVNENNEDFGDDLIKEIVSGMRGSPVSQIRKELHKTLKEFQGNNPAKDDATLLILSRP